ncbi:MAG: hypothetical protein IH616_15960 [Gemmatimonadales bacterium]|nr:hypothetical protein [Gemmatimonadales bacterium]
MSGKTFEFAPQDHIELYEETARRFLREVLDLNANECAISDESHLSDFSSCGLPDGIAETAGSLDELYATWDAWVLGELKARYGLEYTTTAMPLLTLFRDLEQYWRQREH